MERDIRFDNAKGVLIFLVVLGHLLELCSGMLSKTIYLVVYSFHMPAFVFISGYFARFDVKKILKRILLPYFIWHTLYSVLFRLCFGEGGWYVPITPYWLTWYLFSLALWSFSIPVLEWGAGKSKRIVLVALICISLIWGTAGVSGYAFSIGRTLTFWPFFAAGYYLKKRGIPDKIPPAVKISSVVLAAACAAVCIAFSKNWGIECFYGSKAYAEEGQSFALRAFQLISGTAFSALFISFSIRKRLPLVTECGRYSVSVFLLHGIVVRVIEHAAGGLMPGITGVVFAVFLAAALCAALGRKRVYIVFEKIM